MPSVSVVVASKVGPPFIDQCLQSLEAQARRLGAEVVVVSPRDEAYARELTARYPWARSVRTPDIAEVPALRRRGVELAKGELIAVIEEHCSAKDDWLDQALRAHERGRYAGVGGPIVHCDYDHLADWVVYFLEYNGALPPAPDIDTPALNDANIAYRRDVLIAHLPLLDQGYWPMALHPTLAGEGHHFRSVPDMIVYHRGPFPFFYYLRQRYLFSRAFAGVRAQKQGPARRFTYLVAAPIVPFVLLARIARTVLAKRCRVGKLLAALPMLTVAVVVLVAGEWVGCLLGPGDALSKVE